MGNERARRRPGFRSGWQVRMADGQAWSLPVPELEEGTQGKVESGWDNPSYRAILRSVAEAEDAGELFRAELALAIHLLRWNYQLDVNDLHQLLDDQEEEGRPRVGLGEALHALALAHLGVGGHRTPLDPLGDREKRAGGPLRWILRAAWSRLAPAARQIGLMSYDRPSTTAVVRGTPPLSRDGSFPSGSAPRSGAVIDRPTRPTIAWRSSQGPAITETGRA